MSPYTHRAAPRLPLAVAPHIAFAPYRDPSPRHERLYEELSSPPRALPRHRPAIATASGAHGELHPPAACTADACCSCLPLAPTEVPPPLVGHAEPPARWSNHSSCHRRRSPPSPPAGPLPAVCKHSNRSLATPRPSLATSPAKAAGEVTGIRPAAPSPCPWTTLLTLTSFQGCNCEPGA
jgi:hypothetical protein